MEMLYYIIMSQSVLYYLIIAVVITEYITGFIKNAVILTQPRNCLKTLPKLGQFFTDLLECGYCLSVWVAGMIVGISIFFVELPTIVDNYILNILILSIFTASFSNCWHGFRDRYLDTSKDIRYKEL